MGIYWRYKNSTSGFRSLVQLLETTPPIRRKKMIDAGMAEDASYTLRALEFVMEFKDLLGLPEEEMAEVISNTPAQIAAYALKDLNDQKKLEMILRCARPDHGSEIKIFMETEVPKNQILGAQLKMISIARELEQKGRLHVKEIPNAA
mgnify:CR=1 FL=1